MQLSRHIDKGFWATASNVIKALYGFALVMWLIAVFPKSAFANYLIVQTTYLVLAQLISGFSFAAFIKFYYEKEHEVELQSSSLVLFCAAGILVMAIFSIFVAPLRQALNMARETDLLLYVPALFFASAPKLFSNELFKARHEIKFYFLTEVTFFLSHSLMVVLIYLYHGLNRAEDVLTPMVAAYFLSSLLGLWLARQGIIFHFRLRKKNLIEVLRFNRFVLAIGISNNIFEHVDTYVVAGFLDKASLALFGALKLFTRFFTMFRQVVGTLGFPAFARLHSEGRERDLRSLYEKGIYYATVLLGLLVVFILLTADIFFDIIMKQYAGNGFYLRIFILLGLFVGWQTIGDNLLYGIGKPRIVFYNRLFASIFNVAMNLVLIPRFGITGAIITANLTMFLLMLSTTYFVRRNLAFTFHGIWAKRRDLYYFIKNYLKKS